jgi:transcriptional regulator with XRE-family HTH domain
VENIDMEREMGATDVEERRAEIAQHIRDARRERGLTQEQLARLLCCSRIKMNRVEHGQADLTVIELDMLARALCFPASYFFA